MLLLGIHIKHCLDVRYDLETKRNRLQKLKLHVDKLTSGGWVPRWRNERESHLTSTSRHRPIFPELQATYWVYCWPRICAPMVLPCSTILPMESHHKGELLASSSQPSQPNHSSCNSAQWLCGPSDLAHTLASWDDWMSNAGHAGTRHLATWDIDGHWTSLGHKPTCTLKSLKAMELFPRSQTVWSAEISTAAIPLKNSWQLV